MKSLVRNPFTLTSLLVLLCPLVAQAHPGTSGHAHGFNEGLFHPITGLDHICAMVAVGLWAAQRGGRAIWLVPLTFVSAMALGGLLGTAGAQVPFVKQGIVASVLVLGVLIAAALRLPVAVSAAIVGLFAVFHGFAHGAEMPINASGSAYGIGFVLATATLHLFGLGIGLMMQRYGEIRGIRFAGGAVACYGLILCLT
jgi:urease accessory protein